LDRNQAKLNASSGKFKCRFGILNLIQSFGSSGNDNMQTHRQTDRQTCYTLDFSES